MTPAEVAELEIAELERRLSTLDDELTHWQARATQAESALGKLKVYVELLEGNEARLLEIATRPNEAGYWLPEWVRREIKRAVGAP